jgi:hypothetical protein
MFVGHYGLALAARRAAPRTSAGTLVAASVFLDLLWPVLLLLGLERVAIAPGLLPANALDFVSYPISHSLVTVMGWGLVFGGVVLAVSRSRTAAIVAAALVVSHWVLDLVVHRPDLPLWPGGPLVGVGVWRSIPMTLIVELAVLGGGLALYLRATTPRDRIGSIGPWAFTVLLSLVWIASIFGPPPPDWQTVAWSANLQWLFVAMAAWVDRHRMPATAPGS